MICCHYKRIQNTDNIFDNYDCPNKVYTNSRLMSETNREKLIPILIITQTILITVSTSYYKLHYD